MQRLIAFGDSFTYGHHLPDCLEQCNPSKHAWPEVLGSQIKRLVINKSFPGSSNIEILFNVLNFKFEPDDLVIIGWTVIYRDLIYKKSLFGRIFNSQEHKKITLHDNDELSKKWADVHNSYDLAIRSGLHIEHCNLHLEQLKVNHYHFFALDIANKKPIWTHKPKTWIDKTIIKYKDFALDNSHPGINSHKHAADKLYRIINKNG